MEYGTNRCPQLIWLGYVACCSFIIRLNNLLLKSYDATNTIKWNETRAKYKLSTTNFM